MDRWEGILCWSRKQANGLYPWRRRRIGGVAPRILMRWMVSFTPGLLTHGVGTPRIHYIGGRVGPSGGLDLVAKKISVVMRIIDHWSPGP
jgi:hypothetical protein